MPKCVQHEVGKNPIEADLRRRYGFSGIGVKFRFDGPVNEADVRAFIREKGGFGFHPGGYDWTVKIDGLTAVAYVSSGSD